MTDAKVWFERSDTQIVMWIDESAYGGEMQAHPMEDFEGHDLLRSLCLALNIRPWN